MRWELKYIKFLNDVISLFFLPHCGVCRPAKCSCNVAISLQKTHYSIVDLRNRTGEESSLKPCVASVTIILFEKTFRQTSPSFK